MEYNAIMEVPTRYQSAYETKTKVDIRTIILDRFEMDFKCIDIGAPCQVGYSGQHSKAKTSNKRVFSLGTYPTCIDVDECVNVVYPCDRNAKCLNTLG